MHTHIAPSLICAILGFVFLLLAAFPPFNSRVSWLPLGLAFAFLSTFVTAL